MALHSSLKYSDHNKCVDAMLAITSKLNIHFVEFDADVASKSTKNWLWLFVRLDFDASMDGTLCSMQILFLPWLLSLILDAFAFSLHHF